MSEGRIQDWIRYVQERTENVPEDATREAPRREDAQRAGTRREEAGGKQEAVSSAKSSAAYAAVPHAVKQQISTAERTHVTTAIAPGAPHEEALPKARRGRVKADVNESGSNGRESHEGIKQRQRQRPESRAQMLERLTNPLISLHEASVLLGVCAATVRRYTTSGALPHVRTPGGQRRFHLRDVLALERDRKIKRK